MSGSLYRRNFLKFLAASPLAAQDPLSVMDFEALAKEKLPPAHFGYLSTGIDDDKTLRANREGFDKIYLRPRRLVDISVINSGLTLFGKTWETPIILAPAGSQKAYHPEGEIASARAANAKGHLQILSTVTSSSIEEVARQHTNPIWYQLYPTDKWEVTEKLVHHAEAANCPTLVVTVDTQAGRNTETQTRMTRLDTRTCSACHNAPKGSMFTRNKPMFEGIDTVGMRTNDLRQTWDVVDKFRKLTKMKVLIKGIETAEDAQICRERGLDGVVVSNHGSRALETGRGTIECLPEIVQAIGGTMPILIDGGFRRGTDIFKALAIGATAVCIGRPYLWALGAAGQPGVEAVLTILRREFELTMRQCGTASLAAITKNHIGYHQK